MLTLSMSRMKKISKKCIKCNWQGKLQLTLHVTKAGAQMNKEREQSVCKKLRNHNPAEIDKRIIKWLKQVKWRKQVKRLKRVKHLKQVKRAKTVKEVKQVKRLKLVKRLKRVKSLKLVKLVKCFKRLKLLRFTLTFKFISLFFQNWYNHLYL